MWNCPNCHRSFEAKNQSHSCVIVEANELFNNKPTFVKEIYNELLDRCNNICPIEIDTTKSCIYFVNKKRFIAIKPQKNGLIIEFVLNRSVDFFPVIKIIEIGKFKYVHRLMIDGKTDITNELIGWIEDAYNGLMKA